MIFTCRDVSCLLGSSCSLNKTLLAFALFHLVLQPQACLLFCVSLSFLFLHSNALWWIGLLCVWVLKDFVDLHGTSQLQPLQHQRMGHRFRLLWWWMVYLGNGPRSFCHFWCCTKYCISIFSVNYEDYSISFKGLFTILVDIMVIWIKFICFCLKLPWCLRW